MRRRCANAYRVGSPVVRKLAQHWPRYQRDGTFGWALSSSLLQAGSAIHLSDRHEVACVPAFPCCNRFSSHAEPLIRLPMTSPTSSPEALVLRLQRHVFFLHCFPPLGMGLLGNNAFARVLFTLQPDPVRGSTQKRGSRWRAGSCRALSSVCCRRRTASRRRPLRSKSYLPERSVLSTTGRSSMARCSKEKSSPWSHCGPAARYAEDRPHPGPRPPAHRDAPCLL